VPYFPCPEPSSAASQSANKKRKAEVAKKPATKKVKVGMGRASSSRVVPPPPKAGPARKVGVLKISWLKAGPGPRGTSVIELALAKPDGVSKKFRLLDVVALSHTHAVGATMTHTA
jgi:hypothetical protein